MLLRINVIIYFADGLRSKYKLFRLILNEELWNIINENNIIGFYMLKKDGKFHTVSDPKDLSIKIPFKYDSISEVKENNNKKG